MTEHRIRFIERTLASAAAPPARGPGKKIHVQETIKSHKRERAMPIITEPEEKLTSTWCPNCKKAYVIHEPDPKPSAHTCFLCQTVFTTKSTSSSPQPPGA